MIHETTRTHDKDTQISQNVTIREDFEGVQGKDLL